MKRLLITGFAPFGGDRVNPSWQAVQALPETVGGWELCKRELPVTFRGAPKALFEAMDETEPDAVLMVLASELYDEADYIRSYDEFLDFVEKTNASATSETFS